MVELMVALAVGLFLMAGVLQIYLGSRQSYRVQESLSRLQENGRFALMFMEKDIRMTGYRGCATRASTAAGSFNNVLNTPTDYLWDFETPVQGYEATSDTSWHQTLDSSFSTYNLLGGSDILTVRRAAGEAYRVITHASGSADVTVDDASSFEDDDTVMVANCESAAAFEIASISSDALVHGVDLGRSYAGGDVFAYDTVSYYVRTGTTNRPSLYRKIGTETDELITDVEDMQITYGIDDNGNALVDRYVTADTVPDWNDVISININLLLVTPDDNLTPSGEPQPYVFNGITYDGQSGNGSLPVDNRLRRAFTSTVTLRNKTL